MAPTEHQRRIVQTTLPHVEVVASPGSGKTTTLVQRLAHLVRCGVSASEILVLSFSNDAVGEIRRRWVQHGTKQAPSQRASQRTGVAQPVMLTAHAFARGVVARAGGGGDVITPPDAATLLKSALRRCLHDAHRRKLWARLDRVQRGKWVELVRTLRKRSELLSLLLSAMQFAQAAQVELGDVMAGPQFADDLKPFAVISPAILRRYRLAKQAAGRIDFGDMLERAIRALGDGRASIPFTHVLVDEYQDCSAAQTQLLAALARRGCELMVFGDPEQAIYGFGGNGYTPLRQIVDGAKVLSLPQSHRLHSENAALASAVANARTAAIKTTRQGTPPVLVRSRDLTDQTQSVVRDIEQLINQGIDPSRIAVLARTRAFLAPVAQRLLAMGLDAQQQGVTRDLRHVQRVLRLVSLTEGHAQRQEPIDPARVLYVLRCVTFAGPQPCWKSMARSLQRAARSASLEGRYRACADVYLHVLGGVRANTEAHHDLNRWAPICRTHARAAAMLQAIKQPDKAVILTMTIHAAKGREWDHVFVVGVADGQLPLYLAKGAKMLAEERRLLYVAITRARESLRLYFAPVNHARSQQHFEKRSRFLRAKSVMRTVRVALSEPPR
jgi:DNA helicase-2/ATP-dependent DNA helicase PcrA